MIIKDRARRPLVLAPLRDVKDVPSGVGGFATNEACVEFRVGDYRVIMTRSQFQELMSSALDRLLTTRGEPDDGLVGAVLDRGERRDP